LTLRVAGGEPEALRAARVTAGLFGVLRVRPARGRAFTSENEMDGRDHVVLLSDALWRRRFGASPDVVGRTIPLEGRTYEVLGILPPDVTYPIGSDRPADLWVPYVVPPDERVRHDDRISIYLQCVARLKPGVSIRHAQAQMDQVAAALKAANPAWNKDSRIGVQPLRDYLVGAEMKSWMLMLLGAVGIVLLIACANVANLLLARSSVREREIGIRAALGAGRWRLIRQLLLENFVLSIAATVLATILAWWAIEVLRTSMPEGVPRVAGIALNVRVLAAAAGLSLMTALLFGIVPALQLSKTDLSTALKEGTRSAGAGCRPGRMRSALVVAEVALAVVLLVAASLFIGSFIALMRIDPGFNPEHVLTADISPRWEPGQRSADSAAQFIQIVDRVSQVHGVMHSSMISGGMPLGGGMTMTDFRLRGQTLQNSTVISFRVVTPAYHNALRIPLKRGRLLNPTDRKGAANVVIINESAVRKYFGAEDSLGERVVVGGDERTVVGVVGDVRQTSLEREPDPEAYVPMAQSGSVSGVLMIRTNDDPYNVFPAVRSAVLSVMPDVPLREVQTMAQLVSRRIAWRRLSMLLLGLFGTLGLAISSVGIYGVMAYTVSQRTREIGVRMALGATRSRVIGMILVNACVLVVLGLIIGTMAGWYLNTAAKAFLFRLDSSDPRAFIAALLSLSFAAFVASAVPATRAAMIDPTQALRAE
jgi:putative ABC transport system permease protein